MPSRIYTIETRVSDPALLEYLNTYATEYSAITREVWHDMTSPDFKVWFPKMSGYVTYLCNKHGILKRTVNAIRFDVQGRMKSLMELKKTELAQTNIKIRVKEDKIADSCGKLDDLKAKAVANTITDKELERYRSLKTSLYWQKNKLNKLRQRKSKLEYQITNRIYDMCYGSKALFDKQYRLSENGYKTHEKWHNDFVKARDKNIFYLGSADETLGNQLCQLRYDETDDSFSLRLRKENKYCESHSPSCKYLTVTGIDFKYMKAEVVDILRSYGKGGNGAFPLSYRFHRVKNKWYLQVIFERSFEVYRTTSKYGTIGLDYNDGFIELSETDESGNLVKQKHYDLKLHGTGNRARAEIESVIADIVKYAEGRGKDVVIEDLDFRETKSKQTVSNKKREKRYNRMLHVFDYHRYKQLLHNIGFNHRVNVVLVNPANTSKIGKQKYSDAKKLNVHQAASFVIARRGQGYTDKLVA